MPECGISYVEPIPVEERIASGPARVEVIGNGVFVVLYVNHLSPPELGDGTTRRICERLVLPRSGAAELAKAIERALELVDGKAATVSPEGAREQPH